MSLILESDDTKSYPDLTRRIPEVATAARLSYAALTALTGPRAERTPEVRSETPMSMHLKRRLLSSRPGNAYVEFGLLCPLLVTALGSAADFGLSIWSRARLSDAVSHGAQYAAVVGPGVSSANVQSAVSKSVTPLTGVSVTAPAPACYCVSGSPATLASSNASPCSGSCGAGGTGNLGIFVQITATYTYSPIMPFYARLTSPTLTEKAVVRLQ